MPPSKRTTSGGAPDAPAGDAPPAPPPRRRVVALLVETSNEYARGLLHGIIRYIREHEQWSTYLAEHGRGDAPPDWLARWGGDGIIARIENERIAKAVVASGLPAVDLSAANLVRGMPRVGTAARAIANAAFDHLIERGSRHSGCCGDRRFNWSNWRGAEFQKLAHAAGCACHVLRASAEPRASGEWTNQTGRIAAWVAQ